MVFMKSHADLLEKITGLSLRQDGLMKMRFYLDTIKTCFEQTGYLIGYTYSDWLWRL